MQTTFAGEVVQPFMLNISGAPYAQKRHRSRLQQRRDVAARVDELRGRVAGGDLRWLDELVRKAGKYFVTHYDPASNREFKERVQDAIRDRLERLAEKREISVPLFPSGPIAVAILFVFEHPRSTWRKRTPRGWTGLASKPDEDNLKKAIYDAGTGLLWTDDAQIASSRIGKVRCPQRQPARTVLQVTPWDDQDVLALVENWRVLLASDRG